MSMISEQIENLRRIATEWNPDTPINPVSVTLNQAADTIEFLSAKLHAANMEHCMGNLINKTKLIDDLRLLINRSSLGETTTQTEISIGEVVSLIQSQEIYGVGWILCNERLPEEEGMYLITSKVLDKTEV